VSIEREFSLRFSSREVALLTDVGELVELIDGHASAKK
jgi:hypothetical protein